MVVVGNITKQMLWCVVSFDIFETWKVLPFHTTTHSVYYVIECVFVFLIHYLLFKVSSSAHEEHPVRFMVKGGDLRATLPFVREVQWCG